MDRKIPLHTAADRLRSVEQLLVRPTPQAIFNAEGLLQEVAALVGECSRNRGAISSEMEASIRDFRILCDRVAKLLEGARRVQSMRMRLIPSLTQTYTARAERKIWAPPRTTVNVRM